MCIIKNIPSKTGHTKLGDYEIHVSNNNNHDDYEISYTNNHDYMGDYEISNNNNHDNLVTY